MNIYTVGVLISVFIYLIIGISVGRKIKNIEDYYVSGRNATTLFITGTVFASMLSTNGFMGDTAYVYGGNITILILINTICACGYIVGGLFFGRYIRRAKVNTMPGYFWQRFNSKRIRQFAGIITIVSLSAYLLSVMQGTSQLMETMTGLSRFSCLLLSWACIMIFTLYSGSRGVLVTDTVMFIFFLTATVLAGQYIFDAAGGLENLVSNLVSNPNSPEGLLAYHGNKGGHSAFDNVFYGLTIGIIWMITVAVSPWQAGRNLMAKNEHIIFRSGSIAALMVIFFLLYLYLMAISVIQLYPNMEEPESVIIWTAFTVMPKFIGVMLLTGIMSAGLSSASTFLSVVSFCMSSDILDIKFRKESSNINFSRFIVFVVSLIALVLASMDISSMRIIAWFASTIIAASWGFLAFASVWSKKLTERGAYYAMVGGFFGYLLCKCLQEFFDIPFSDICDPFYIGVLISILGGVFGSMGQIKTHEEILFQEKLHVVPESEMVALDYKIDRIYGWVMIMAGIAISAFLIKYWAIPYNEAIGASLLTLLK